MQSLSSNHLPFSVVLKIVFVRHAESENNVLHQKLRQHGREKEFEIWRQPDPVLSPLGVDQMNRAAAAVQEMFPEVEEIWVSYLKRALQTAQALHTQSPKTVVRLNKDLAEIGGHWYYCHTQKTFLSDSGRKNVEVRNEHPTFQVDGRCDEGWWSQEKGRETPQQAARRAQQVISMIEHRAIEFFLQKSNTTDLLKDRRQEQEADGVCLLASGSKDLPHKTIAIVTHGEFFMVFLSIALGLSREGAPAVCYCRKPEPSPSSSSPVVSASGPLLPPTPQPIYEKSPPHDKPPPTTTTEVPHTATPHVKNCSITVFEISVASPRQTCEAPHSASQPQEQHSSRSPPSSLNLQWRLRTLNDVVHLGELANE